MFTKTKEIPSFLPDRHSSVAGLEDRQLVQHPLKHTDPR